MQRRPLINTRDEPHANPALWRRFHVILGDANLSPFATWLKVGTTALVLEAITRQPHQAWPRLDQPVETLRRISRDPGLALGGPHHPGPSHFRARDPEPLSRMGRAVLRPRRPRAPFPLRRLARGFRNDLATDPMRCRDRLDWVAKLAFIREFQAAEDVPDDDPWLRSLDLEYHRLDPQEGLYFGLEQAGALLGIPDPAEVERAVHEPPADTRAAVRGACIAKFGAAVTSAQWDHVTLASERGPVRVDLTDLFTASRIQAVLRAVADAGSPEDLHIPASFNTAPELRIAPSHARILAENPSHRPRAVGRRRWRGSQSPAGRQTEHRGTPETDEEGRSGRRPGAIVSAPDNEHADRRRPGSNRFEPVDRR